MAALSGCPPEQSVPPPGEARIITRPILPHEQLPGGEDKEYMLIVRLQLTSIEVPVGVASGSEEIWSYLDEEPVRQVRTPVLGFNGLRIGRGAAGSWGDLAEVLRRMTGRKLRESCITAIPARPVPIVLKTHQPAQTIFFYRPDRTLRGFDYPPGENLLTISCTLDGDDPSKVLITGLPQIRTTHRRPQFVNEDGKFAMVNRPDIFPLTPLTFQVAVASKDFLVIGPAAEARRCSSVGGRFLVKEKDGVKFETVLVISPQTFATPIRPRPLTIQR